MPEIKQDIRAATFVVAANDSVHKNDADYVCDGTADNEEIQAALDAITTIGGSVSLSEGTFNIAATIIPPLRSRIDLVLNSGTILKPTADIDVIKVRPKFNLYGNGAIIDTSGFAGYTKAAILFDGADQWGNWGPDWTLSIGDIARVQDLTIILKRSPNQGIAIHYLADADNEYVCWTMVSGIHVYGGKQGVRMYVAPAGGTAYINANILSDLHFIYTEEAFRLEFGGSGDRSIAGNRFLAFEVQVSTQMLYGIRASQGGSGNFFEGSIIDWIDGTGYIVDLGADTWKNNLVISAPGLLTNVPARYRDLGLDNVIASPSEKKIYGPGLEGIKKETIGSDHKWVGEARLGTAGENLAFPDLVYFKSDGKWWKADADALATTDGLLGVASATIAANASGIIIIPGSQIRDNTWALTIGGKLYVSPTAGAITQTAPFASGQQVRIIGYCYPNADTIFFNPDSTIVEIA